MSPLPAPSPHPDAPISIGPLEVQALKAHTQRHSLPKVYGFVNGGSPGWYSVEAISEDGVFLAGHCCSHPFYGPHDIGVTSDWHHEPYRAYYPDGFEVIWIADSEDDRLKAAYAAHLAMDKETYAAKMAPVVAEHEARERAKAEGQ